MTREMEAEAQLVTLMERLSGEFRELKESFKELKAENAVLRKEILGIGAAAASADQMGLGLMEKTTLRELVEEIQFDVKALNAKVERSLREEKCRGNGNKSSGENCGEQGLPSPGNDVDTTAEAAQRFPVVEIKFKTIAEQREGMKKIFFESVKPRSFSEGASYRERRRQSISSIFRNLTSEYSTSCTMKFYNHLNYAVTDPRFHFWMGNKTSGPSEVDPHVRNVFTFQGIATPSGSCSFLCSFGISSSLRLTIYSRTTWDKSVRFGMAFTPQDVPTDEKLYDKLRNISSEPDIWMDVSGQLLQTWDCQDRLEHTMDTLLFETEYIEVPLEVVINNGKLFARGHMTPGPFSVIHIDIIEVSETEAVGFPIPPKMKPLEDGESMRASLTSSNLLHGSSLDKIACIIEIGNCLNSTLRNPSGFFTNTDHNNSLPSEILPFYQEKFITFAETTLEGMIESTDLCLLVALRVESGNNSFAVTFAQFPVKANRKALEALMNPKAWKTHEYKKYAHAEGGEQVIEIRNIRASVKMTEDKESLLKIRVFAFE